VMAATDSYRLAVKETPMDAALPELEAIIPARALQELSRIAAAADEVQLGLHDNHVVFGADGVWLTTRRIDGQFPNYRQLLPEQFEHEVTLPREEALEVVRRVSLMAQRNSPLRLRFAEGELTVSAVTQDVGTQGFSPRTRQDTQLIHFGETAARIAVAGRRAGTPFEVSLTLRQGQAKEARLNGARLPSAESLRRELATLVFTPDRLAVVKGGPAARRAYFDRVLARLFPARAGLPQVYLSALAQRNAALRRVQLGLSGVDVLTPWTERVAHAGAALVEARQAALAALAAPLGERAGGLGLEEARLTYDGEPPTLAALES